MLGAGCEPHKVDLPAGGDGPDGFHLRSRGRTGTGCVTTVPVSVETLVIQSQNAEVGYLYRRRLHVDEEKCPKRLLVNVVQPFRQEVSISRRINFQPPPN